MKNKFLVVVALLCLCGVTSAQNPGYLGRRLSLNYSLYTLNALRFPNECGNSGFLSFNTLHYINADITVGRRTGLGVAVEYMRTSIPYSEPLHYSSGYDPYGYYNYGSFTSKDVGKMETWGAGLYLKRYFRGNIAPLGTYFKPQITVLISNVQPGNPVNRNGQTFDDLDIRLRNMDPYFNLAISLELGQNRIFFNRLFIDYGIRLGIIPKASSIVDDYRSDLTEDTYIDDVYFRRLASHYLINVKAGVGVLLF